MVVAEDAEVTSSHDILPLLHESLIHDLGRACVTARVLERCLKLTTRGNAIEA